MFDTVRVAAFCTVLLLAACTTPSRPTAVTPDASGEPMASSNEAAGESAAVVEDDPIVCERVTQIGTRVAQRICKRQSQIDAEKRAAEEVLGEVQKRGALDSSRRE